jgi:hypothetical protein
MAERLDAIIGMRDAIRGQITPEGDGSITPPTNIIKTITAARSVYYKYRTEHVKRIQLYALIEGLIAGNPPYNQGDLMKHGLSHIANFNTLDGRSLYERSALAYWNLINEAETIAKFTIRDPAPEARAMEDIMSKEWDTVVRRWPSFNTLMNTNSAQLVKFGISPVLWPDERDWRWRVIELSKFFIPDQAQSDIEMITAVCVESMFTAQYLFEVYEAFKDVDIDKSPWNCKELAAILLHIANSFAKTSYEFIDFMDLQKRLQNGDIGYDALFTDSIRIVSLFYKEYEGKFSHYMFHRTFDAGDFLYFADRQYGSLNEALVVFTASPGEYTIHSNRGLGHKIFPISQATMQLDCSIVDAARWASTPLLRGVATGSRDFEQIRFYPGVPTNIGTAEFVQNNMGANINQLVGASQYLNQKVQFNTANSGDDPGTPDRDKGSISPTQARMQSYKEFSVLKNNIAHYYSQQDNVFQNMVIKMLLSKKGYPGYEYAKEWKDRCLEQGVPKEVFDMGKLTPWGMPRQLQVKASRVAGDGSTLARIMGLQELMNIAGDFGPRESKEFKRQWIMATMGVEYVDTFLQGANTSDETAGGASLAGVENNGMQNGQSPIFSPDNEHKSHFAIHMALATHSIEAIQQQQLDPVAADKVFTVLIPHLQEHYQAAARSPFSQVFVAQNKKPLGQVVQYATLNRKNAEAMLKAQIAKAEEEKAQTQATMNEEQRKDVKLQGDERRANYKVESQVARASEANSTRAEVMKEKVQKDADVNREKILLDAENKKIENQSKALIDMRKQLNDMSGQTPAPADMESTTQPFFLGDNT